MCAHANLHRQYKHGGVKKSGTRAFFLIWEKVSKEKGCHTLVYLDKKIKVLRRFGRVFRRVFESGSWTQPYLSRLKINIQANYIILIGIFFLEFWPFIVTFWNRALSKNKLKYSVNRKIKLLIINIINICVYSFHLFSLSHFFCWNIGT